MVPDKEIQHKQYVGCGEDSTGVVVDLLDIVERVATILAYFFISGRGGVSRGDGGGWGKLSA